MQGIGISVLLLALALAACGTSAPASAGFTGCAPGVQIACACPGGAKGVQSCLPDGTGFSECGGCLAADATATGGSGDSSPPSDVDVADAVPDDAGGAAVDSNPPADAPGDSDVALTCSNGVKDGLETDTDCGGPQCAACNPGKACALGPDCKSTICVNEVCQEPTGCSNGVKDSLETDIDCGGAACSACGSGKACIVPDDCTGKACVNGTCSMATTCADGKKNAQETAVDCGGPLCPKCADGSACLLPSDCVSAACSVGVCGKGAGCTDGVKSGKETDIDCGGGECKPCESGKQCAKGQVDCTSLLCINTQCTAPSCSDQVKNGQETDVDCGGGGECVPCGIGQVCLDAPDCLSQLCFNGACKVQPTCSDGAKNGNETAVDCGGTKCDACGAGKTCIAGKDCQSGICKNNVCLAPTCKDLTQNGDETDVDCGGSICAKCALGLGCKVAGDCTAPGSDLCSIVTCTSAQCTKSNKACDDGNLCTSDGCDPAVGKCLYVNNAASCDDGNVCTTDSCDAGSGKCNYKNTAGPCTDGLACTADSCQAGACISAAVACGGNATCVEPVGCQCKPGFSGDGKTCSQCKASDKKRCWVECPEAYPSGCINAGLPVMIMGTQACADGQWQPCVTNAVCGDYKGTCTNSTKAPTTVLCTDGVSKKVGGYLCLKPIGAQCNVSYYSSWPMADCPDLCTGPDDVCTTAGEKRECTATCGSPSGPAVKGTQNCNAYCSGKFWGPCLSDDACLKMSK
jgi:hypothetical protein